jgi:hypothetical protein
VNLIIDQLDLTLTRERWPREQPFEPALVKPKSKLEKGNWRVLSAPMEPGGVPEWAHAGGDDYVRIPLFRYALNPSADLALAFMLQLGLSCAGNLPGQVTDFYVVTGTPVELLYDSDTNINTGLSYWVGFAVIVA